MPSVSTPTTNPHAEHQQSWLPMVIIAMGQAQLSLNINALPVSIGAIVAEFTIAPTTVGTVIVAHAINAEARLRALKLSFLLLAAVALLAIVPAGRLPD